MLLYPDQDQELSKSRITLLHHELPEFQILTLQS
jgi:hypothetical protein